MRKITVLILVVGFFFSALNTSVAQRRKKEKYDVKAAATTIADFKKADAGIAAFFNNSYGYAVFPSIGKGAIGVGGAAGKGVVYRNGEVTGGVNMTQISIGFQFGGQAYSEVIFFEDADAYTRFIENELQLAAQASAVALKSGISANAKYTDGVAVFTMAKGGLMYEASIGGQKFKFIPLDKMR
ncbi:YSC84-related protein [Roseivirga sp. UBA838]|uniref:lipid-binding SYLF domain-containing protein n=1 Tax=Roseivirga sp. UBA838 TaxID=1947393 RepID=UPI002580EA45|nr:YSC84-related protein [Roseivirga sp. UBA838]|tara:strand:+ start:81829 stop:82380 length:552 start_codon:yes stop_codon:yes gene_type:complete